MLSVKLISKRYGAQIALDRLSFNIEPGQFCALLGPNGAGKSTLFQILTGLFSPDGGEVALCGISLQRQAPRVLAQIGVVFQQQSLDLELSVRRNLVFHAKLHGLSWGAQEDKAQALLTQLGLPEAMNKSCRVLSGGNRRKVELVRALVHAPALILMDEPTVGLDPKSRQELLRAVQSQVAERGCMALWATHLVEEATTADQVLVLQRGKLMAYGTPAQVQQTLGSETLEQGFIRLST